MTNDAARRSVPRSGTATALTRLSGAGLVRFLDLERRYVDEADRLAICARVREAREKAGFEQPEFAEMLTPPVTVRTLHNYEHFRPPFKYLRQWSEITRFSYDWLLRGEEPSVAGDPRPQPELGDLRSRLEEVAEIVAEGFDGIQQRLDLLQSAVDSLRTAEGEGSRTGDPA